MLFCYFKVIFEISHMERKLGVSKKNLQMTFLYPLGIVSRKRTLDRWRDGLTNECGLIDVTGTTTLPLESGYRWDGWTTSGKQVLRSRWYGLVKTDTGRATDWLRVNERRWVWVGRHHENGLGGGIERVTGGDGRVTSRKRPSVGSLSKTSSGELSGLSRRRPLEVVSWQRSSDPRGIGGCGGHVVYELEFPCLLFRHKGQGHGVSIS